MAGIAAGGDIEQVHEVSVGVGGVAAWRQPTQSKMLAGGWDAAGADPRHHSPAFIISGRCIWKHSGAMLG
jgi:hypothetical protein